MYWQHAECFDMHLVQGLCRCRHLIGIRGTSWGKAIIAAIAFHRKKR